ncbi:hypothetical protein JTB14_027947 [Gonioctena quinquepunctata]|nr:hypothetical protein JTB14_027947 [Gonioctena quinquepunctata]
MDDSKAGPSGIEKRKLVCKDPKNLTNDELLKILEESSDDEKYFSDDGDHFELDESSSDGTDDSDDEAGAVLSTTQGQPQVPVITNLAAAANPAVGATPAATIAAN